MASFGYGTGTGVRKAGSKWGGRGYVSAAEKREIRERKCAYIREQAREYFAKDGKVSSWPFGYNGGRDENAMIEAWNDEMRILVE